MIPSFEIVICAALFFLDLALLLWYLAKVYIQYGYVFSLFNITLFSGSFTLFLGPLFLFRDETWAALNKYSAEAMAPYVLQNMFINLFGYFIFILVLILYQKRREEKAGILTMRVSNSIAKPAIDIFSLACIVVYIAICLTYNSGTFPLLNGQRAFYYQTPISPIYQAVSKCIAVLGLSYGISAVSSKKSLILFFVCSTCLILSGNRGTVLLTVIFPALLYWIYYSGRKNHGLKGIKQSNSIIVILLLSVVVFGLVLQGIRSGSGVGITQLLVEMIDGNTFSDIRDGAYILYGLEINENVEVPIYGKTYLAALMSFIPSSLSEYRDIWSWGRFSTSTLFGWGTHFGLRGGWFLEAYINFGYIGVVINASLAAMLLARLESIFRKVFLSGEYEITGIEIIPCMLALQVFAVLNCSASFYYIYVLVILVVVLSLLSLPFLSNSKKNHNMLSSVDKNE